VSRQLVWIALILSGCEVSSVIALADEVEIGTNGHWTRLAGTELAVERMEFELRNPGRRQVAVQFDFELGDCDRLPSVELPPGELRLVTFKCRRHLSSEVFRVRLTAGSVFGFVGGTLPFDAIDTGVTPGVCEFSIEPFASNFGRIEPGGVRSRIIGVRLERGLNCRFSLSLDVGTAFTLRTDRVGRLEQGGVEIVQDAPGTFGVWLDFQPDRFDADWSDVLTLKTIPSSGGALHVGVRGSSSPQCPSFDSTTCPRPAPGMYLSSNSDLFRIEHTLERVGAFRDPTDRPVPASDIAATLDGRLLLLSGDAVYVVDPVTAVVRRILQLDDTYNSMDILPDGGLLLGGDGVVMMDVEGVSVEQVIPRGTVLSGDLAIANINNVFATLGSAGSQDVLGAIDIEAKSLSIIGPLGYNQVFGLAWGNGELTGFTNTGLALSIAADGIVSGVVSLPGSWTGAAWVSTR